MESLALSDDDIVRANFGNNELCGAVRIGGNLFFSLDFTAEASAARRPIVTPRTDRSNVLRPLIPISAALAEELGLDD